MESRIQKWGNSLAVRIPKPFASEVGLHQDAEVELQVSKGSLVITPLKWPAYKLSDLLEDVRPSNLHREVLTGGSMGLEAW
jgi:antitoxin MazE